MDRMGFFADSKNSQSQEVRLKEQTRSSLNVIAGPTGAGVGVGVDCATPPLPECWCFEPFPEEALLLPPWQPHPVQLVEEPDCVLEDEPPEEWDPPEEPLPPLLATTVPLPGFELDPPVEPVELDEPLEPECEPFDAVVVPPFVELPEVAEDEPDDEPV